MVDIDDVTQEQLDELQTKAEKVEELEKYKEDSQAAKDNYEKEKAEWEAKEKEYQEAVNPNWQKTRKQIDALKSVAKEKGIEVDDEGNVINSQQNISMEEIENRAKAIAKQEYLGNSIDKALENYDDESKGVIKHFFDKLIVGEDVTIGNFNKFIRQAENAAKLEMGDNFKTVPNVDGSSPRKPNETALEDSKAKNLGQNMGLNFAKEDNK